MKTMMFSRRSRSTRSRRVCRHNQMISWKWTHHWCLTGQLRWTKRRRRRKRRKTKGCMKTSVSWLLLRQQVRRAHLRRVPSQNFDLRNKCNVCFTAEDDYEDLSCGQKAVAIYDYVGGERLFHPVTSPVVLWIKPFHLPPPRG